MDSVLASCPNCSASGPVDNSYIGKTVKCQQCGTSFVITAQPAQREPSISQAPPLVPPERTSSPDPQYAATVRSNGSGVQVIPWIIGGVILFVFMIALVSYLGRDRLPGKWEVISVKNSGVSSFGYIGSTAEFLKKGSLRVEGEDISFNYRWIDRSHLSISICGVADILDAAFSGDKLTLTEEGKVTVLQRYKEVKCTQQYLQGTWIGGNSAVEGYLYSRLFKTNNADLSGSKIDFAGSTFKIYPSDRNDTEWAKAMRMKFSLTLTTSSYNLSGNSITLTLKGNYHFQQTHSIWKFGEGRAEDVVYQRDTPINSTKTFRIVKVRRMALTLSDESRGNSNEIKLYRQTGYLD